MIVAEGDMHTVGVNIALVTEAGVCLLEAIPAFSQRLEGLNEVLVPSKRV
jgi:hypothetical protein